MKVIKQIDIYLTSKRNVKVIDVVQYDTGIQLVFSVKDFTIPTGTTATLYVQKPSGKFVYQEDGITVATNTITINLENQAIAEHGKVPYQVTLKNGSDELTTFEGLMMVQRSLKDSGATESTTVIRAFDNAVSERIAKFQTEAEKIASAVIATIPDDYTVMTAKVNELANAIKGKLSGYVVAADDVSPVGHIPEVWVHGKNLAKRTNEKETETSSGITYTLLADGRVSATGTATGTAYYIINVSTDWAYQIPIKKGFYTIPKAPADGCRISVGIRENQNTERVLYYSTPTNTVTFEVTGNEARFDMILCVDTGKTVNGAIFEPQLEEGETATTYEPYIDPTTVTVRRCGKQVFTGKEYELAKEYAWSSILIAKIFCGSGNYVASCNFKQKGDMAKVGLSVRDYDDTMETLKHVDSTALSGVLTAPFVVQEGKKGFQMFLYSNYSADDLSTDCLFENIQVEVGTEVTPFKPYNATTHIPASDGTVSGMTSLSPNMTILTDTEGVIVECEYNKDTNKVIKKICDALGIEV